MVLFAGYWFLVTGYLKIEMNSFFENQEPTTSNKQPATSYKKQAPNKSGAKYNYIITVMILPPLWS